MHEYQEPDNNRSAFSAFMQYKKERIEKEGLDLGEHREDWESSWVIFLSG